MLTVFLLCISAFASGQFIQPNSSTTVFGGTQQTLMWNNNNTINLNFELNINGTWNDDDGNNFLSIIVDSHINSYDWNVPLYISHYWNSVARLKLTQLNDNRIFYSDNFTIAGITVDNIDSHVYSDSRLNISWGSNVEQTYNIYLYDDNTSYYNVDPYNSSPVYTIINGVVDQNYSWYITNGLNFTNVRLAVISNDGITVGLSNIFTIMSPPTASPTYNPTSLPTTATPTQHPSCFPTTSDPTTIPTVAPSNSPTTTPTVAPSNSPTTTPTVAPSNSPTTLPTVAPSNSPTTLPTTLPTVAPSNSPTTLPTNTPTVAPSNSPTNTPTIDPSCAPTKFPTTTTTTTTTTQTNIPLLNIENNNDDTYHFNWWIFMLIILGSILLLCLIITIIKVYCCNKEKENKIKPGATTPPNIEHIDYDNSRNTVDNQRSHVNQMYSANHIINRINPMYMNGDNALNIPGRITDNSTSKTTSFIATTENSEY